jgi:hypothetical protein
MKGRAKQSLGTSRAKQSLGTVSLGEPLCSSASHASPRCRSVACVALPCITPEWRPADSAVAERRALPGGA